MTESTWTPQPGDRVLIRNAGEYGWLYSDRPFGAHGVEYVGYHYDLRTDELALVRDPMIGLVTVLRSDLSPVEPPREWRCWDLPEVCCRSPWTDEGIKRLLGAIFANDPTFERHTGPGAEETRRLTKEDYADIDATKRAIVFDEMVAELIETVSSKLAESYRG